MLLERYGELDSIVIEMARDANSKKKKNVKGRTSLVKRLMRK